MPDNDECLCYNVNFAAKLLGLSRNATYKACLAGQIPHLKIGKRILIPKFSLQRMLNEAATGEKES